VVRTPSMVCVPTARTSFAAASICVCTSGLLLRACWVSWPTLMPVLRCNWANEIFTQSATRARAHKDATRD
jgi:hypothetical protein